jgi:hypothetical protein
MIESKRLTLIDKEDIVMDLEYNEHYAILHLPVMRINKKTYTEFLSTVPQLHTFLTMVGYQAVWTAIKPEDTTLAKLLGRLGATKKGTAEGLDVYEYTGEK